MLLITTRKRRAKRKPSGPTAEEVAQTPAARLEALSRQLWAGEISKSEHDTRQAQILDRLQSRHN